MMCLFLFILYAGYIFKLAYTTYSSISILHINSSGGAPYSGGKSIWKWSVFTMVGPVLQSTAYNAWQIEASD